MAASSGLDRPKDDRQESDPTADPEYFRLRHWTAGTATGQNQNIRFVRRRGQDPYPDKPGGTPRITGSWQAEITRNTGALPMEQGRMELEGKVALVTGAGSGIGKATTPRLARAGATVGALSHTEDEILQVVQEIETGGGKAVALVADVAPMRWRWNGRWRNWSGSPAVSTSCSPMLASTASGRRSTSCSRTSGTAPSTSICGELT